MKLFSYLDYDDRILMNDLQNKINNRLQNALSVCSENFTSLTRLRIFLQDVNNKQRVNYQLRSQLRTVIVKVTVVPDKCVATSLSAVTTSIIKYVKSTIFFYLWVSQIVYRLLYLQDLRSLIQELFSEQDWHFCFLSFHFSPTWNHHFEE